MSAKVKNSVKINIGDHVKITAVIKSFIDKYNLKTVKILIEDKDNTFLGVSQSPFKYIYQYNSAQITVPAYDNQFDYKQFSNDGDKKVIIIRQVGSCSNDSMECYEDRFDNKDALIIQYNTKSKYGVYSGDSMDLYFRLLL